MGVLDEVEVAMNLVDSLIKECSGRDIVSASEMTDSLLDIRIHIMGIIEREKTDNVSAGVVKK
jgi:hypothetical protein